MEGVCPGWFDAKKGVYLTASGTQAGFMRVKFLEGFRINFFHETERQRKKDRPLHRGLWLAPTAVSANLAWSGSSRDSGAQPLPV